MVKLVVTNTEFKDKEFELTADNVTVGRVDGNDWVIGENSLSGHHAVFKKLHSGDYAILDQNSTNGTFLNGEKITTEKALRRGDKIRLGQVMIDYVSDVVREKAAAGKAKEIPSSAPTDSKFGFEAVVEEEKEGAGAVIHTRRKSRQKVIRSPLVTFNILLTILAVLALTLLAVRMLGLI